MCEAAGIINMRPLTTDTLNDPLSPEPLSPNHLAKSHVVLPPPIEFVREYLYSKKKRWKRVQYLIEQFWTRWKREYLQHLQARAKWNKPKRNMREDLVKSVKLRMADDSIDKSGKRTRKPMELERPVHKPVLLLESESEAGGFQPREPL